MRRLSENSYAEFYWWGCNPGFITSRDGVVLIDTPQQPIDAMRWREMITNRLGRSATSSTLSRTGTTPTATSFSRASK